MGRRLREDAHLDRAAEAIAIDATDTWLYASGPEPTPWIGRFRLREPRE